MNPQPVDPIVLNDVFPFWLDVLTFAPLIIVLFVTLYFVRQGYSGYGFLRKQSDFLDHQKDVNAKAIDQNKAFEDMIARQYAETNARADRALAQSDEAIRLHAAALEQLARMNETLNRVAGTLGGSTGETQSGAPAS